MAKSRKENIRLLRLAIQGKLTPEDLVDKNGGIKITMNLGPSVDYAGTYNEWLASLPKRTKFEKGTKYISVTIDMN